MGQGLTGGKVDMLTKANKNKAINDINNNNKNNIQKHNNIDSSNDSMVAYRKIIVVAKTYADIQLY